MRGAVISILLSLHSLSMSTDMQLQARYSTSGPVAEPKYCVGRPRPSTLDAHMNFHANEIFRLPFGSLPVVEVFHNLSRRAGLYISHRIMSMSISMSIPSPCNHTSHNQSVRRRSAPRSPCSPHAQISLLQRIQGPSSDASSKSLHRLTHGPNESAGSNGSAGH